ncbi:olfactory receptor 6P1-like [Dendrobates tinctorius]|uniref:olfactory receptor 6P1-like n=1 Tax=Dendrobates tinctorius TaxID=92724 RepID=UPI003CC9675B
MNKSNQSISEFLLLGFPDVIGIWATVLFSMILVIYILTLMINAMVIALVSTTPQLHSAMYFFLQQLSVVEFMFLTVVVPNMLRVIWLEGATISVRGCITQAYFYCVTGCVECHLLVVMAYDRYLAICYPLRYNTIMDTRLQNLLLIYCWVFGLLLTQITLNFLCQLFFCGPNVINHFFCDIIPFAELTCSHKFAYRLMILIVSVPLIAIPFILIVVSYIYIFITILGISSTRGRKKTFSTCSSHLTVVTMYYGTLIIIYMVPANGDTLTINKLIAFLYIVITPLFNPIIYCLRNHEMRVIIEKLFIGNNKQ